MAAFRNRSETTSLWSFPSLSLSRAIPAARGTGEKRNAEVISERFLSQFDAQTYASVHGNLKRARDITREPGIVSKENRAYTHKLWSELKVPQRSFRHSLSLRLE
jgi:hypothetical protein